MVARQSYAYMRQSGELVHSMLLDAGFKASNEIMDMPVGTLKSHLHRARKLLKKHLKLGDVDTHRPAREV